MLLSTFFESSYLPLRLAGRSVATESDYRVQLMHADTFLGRPAELADLQGDFLQDLVAWHLARGRSRATANKLGRSVAAVWRFAWQRKLVPEPPQWQRLPEYEHEPRCWSRDELGRIFRACRLLPASELIGGRDASPDWFEAVLWTSYNTGARISALMAAPVEGLDLAGGWILLPAERQKHKRDKRERLLLQTRDALARLDLRGLHTIFGAWPFDANQAGWPTLNRWLGHVLRLAGLPAGPRDKWHKLRRTFATQLAARGGRLAAQEALQHSHFSVTARYLDQRFIAGPNAAELLEPPDSFGVVGPGREAG